ncbi:MAG: CHRD domain-containing protein [Gemmatimonadaceae bacterium]
MLHIVRIAAGVATAAAVVLFAASCDDDDDGDIFGPGVRTYQANLFGANERPNGTTEDGTGVAIFIDRGDRIDWTLTVDDITAVIASHIHGPANPDGNAAVIVDLFMPAAATGELNNHTVTGSFTATNSNQNVTIDELRTHLNSTRAYVNVHTTEFAPGAIRGQVIRTR